MGAPEFVSLGELDRNQQMVPIWEDGEVGESRGTVNPLLIDELVRIHLFPPIIRGVGRVAEGTSLLTRHTERYHRFESYTPRHKY